MIYGHGDDLYQYGDQVKMNFSSNIFTHADLTSLNQHLAKRLDVIGSYPEPEPRTLERLLAEQLKILPQQVMVNMAIIMVIITMPLVIFVQQDGTCLLVCPAENTIH